MMTNRELLINAARAGEIEGKYYIAYGERDVNEGIDIGGGRLWNPLINNADAFGLMVECQMRICDNGNQIFADVNNRYKASIYVGSKPVTDREKYTRGVITKCAAIVGGLDPSVFNHWCPVRK